jgi:Fe-S oxidoreductase
MAGTFGYEAKHYELSQRIGELRLFPMVRERREATLTASGAACRLQITQGTGETVAHPIELVAESLGLRPEAASANAKALELPRRTSTSRPDIILHW